MNLGLRPIETRYKGYRFRSRTEARWAVFFDALGYEWTYEEQGYDLGDGVRYLPDFYVRPEEGINFFAEVKGGATLTMEDSRKLWRFADQVDTVLLLDGPPDTCMYYSAPMLLEKAIWTLVARPYTRRSHCCIDQIQEKTREMDYSISEMSDKGDYSWVTHDLVWAANASLRTSKYNRYGFALHSYKCRIWDDEHVNFWGEYIEGPCIRDAVGYARSARFEHGEQPFSAPPW